MCPSAKTAMAAAVAAAAARLGAATARWVAAISHTLPRWQWSILELHLGDVSISGLGRHQYAAQVVAPKAGTRPAKIAVETGENAILAPRRFTANATRRGSHLAANPSGLEPPHFVEVNVLPGSRRLVRTNLAMAATALQVKKKTANARRGFRLIHVHRGPSKSNVLLLWPPVTMAAQHMDVVFASGLPAAH